jgi:ATP-dependent RNA helicase HelY
VLAEMVRTWSDLDQLEKDNDLSFLRGPDFGFAWAAYRWARGVKLENVLAESPDLTPGDFVRSVKQLIDLLDQIASATPAPAATAAAAVSAATASAAVSAATAPAPAPASTATAPATAAAPAATAGGAPRSLSATARAAIDAMRRGVVAYSAVAD